LRRQVEEKSEITALRFTGSEKTGLLMAENRKIRDLSGVISDLAATGCCRIRSLNCAKIENLHRCPQFRISRESTLRRRCRKVYLHRFELFGSPAEAGMALPVEPVIFMKATSCINGPTTISSSHGDRKKRLEVELGVVIGKPASTLEKSDALSHVRLLCGQRSVGTAFKWKHGPVESKARALTRWSDRSMAGDC